MSVQILSTEANWPNLRPDTPFPRLNAHSEAWYRAVSRGFKHPCYTLIHRDAESVNDAILPLMLVKSLLFGKFLVSLPYVNTGGVWATNQPAASELISAACELSDQLDVRYLELRHEVRVEHPKLTFERLDKVHMRMALPDSYAELEKTFKSKLRSQIKKSLEYDLSIEWGGKNLLSEFYAVFARNMRDLGTPVFSRMLFEAMLEEFAGDAELCIVRRNRSPIAGAILVHQNGIAEVPSASSLRTHNHTNANMWMYGQLLSRAIERGNHTFDFGRSSEDSGTYRFKAQWGAMPNTAIWQYYVRKGSADDMRPDAGNKRILIRVWQMLPVSVASIIGPPIVRGIP